MLFSVLAVSSFISLVTADSCAARFYQCGGVNWTGATCCEAGSSCKSQNPYYFQCVASDADTAAATTSVVSVAATTSKTTTPIVTSSSSAATVSHTHSTVVTTQAVVSSSATKTSTSSSTTLAATSKAASTSSSSKVTSSSSKAASSSSTSTSSVKTSSSASTASAAASSSSSDSDLTFTTISGGTSGTADTTRYWDCCKPSCAWNGKADVTAPVDACLADGVTVAGVDVQSGCVGGDAYMCSNQQPFAINSTLAFGFIAASIVGGDVSTMCCSCVLMTFNDGTAAGKQMVAQITNTGDDLTDNHFDIAIPGGGVGYYTDGCTSQWDAPSGGWGEVYGGVSDEASCSELPTELQSGCDWRWDFLDGADNPTVSFVEIECPAQITDITGCTRN